MTDSTSCLGLEEIPELWKDFILDVAQRVTDNLGRSQRLAPRSRRWLIEAYRKKEAYIRLTLAVRGAGESSHLVAVAIRAEVEVDKFGIAEKAARPQKLAMAFGLGTTKIP